MKFTQDRRLLIWHSFAGQPLPAPWHVPALHIWPWVQALPHWPQLAGSEFSSTQVLPHSVNPRRHAQTVLVQVWRLLHCVPQAPQFRGSASRSRQVCPHRVAPPAQRQAPPAQDASYRVLHWRAHWPQLVKLVLTSTHALLQVTCPAPWQMQVPEVQVALVTQVRPHCPQLAASLEGLTQAPLQRIVPVAQAHWPEEQTWPAMPQFVSVRQVTQRLVVGLQYGVVPPHWASLTQATQEWVVVLQ